MPSHMVGNVTAKLIKVSLDIHVNMIYREIFCFARVSRVINASRINVHDESNDVN